MFSVSLNSGTRTYTVLLIQSIVYIYIIYDPRCVYNTKEAEKCDSQDSAAGKCARLWSAKTSPRNISNRVLQN